MSDATWSFFDATIKLLRQPRRGDSKQPTLWPSEAAALITNKYDEEVIVGRCRRATFFRYLIEKKKFHDTPTPLDDLIKELKTEKLEVDDYLRFIWAQGNLYEDYIIQTAKKMGVFLGTQEAVYIKEHNISGKVDVEIFDPETGLRSIIEVKSVISMGANEVLGTPAQRRNGQVGKPKHSHMMQIALYLWKRCQTHAEEYTYGRLLYGARDTGRCAEYMIDIREDETTGLHWVWYRAIHPHKLSWSRSALTIEAICEEYDYVDESAKLCNIPDRDYELTYTEDRVELLYQRGKLNRTETKRYEKYRDRGAENAALLAAGKPPLRELKPLVKGDWQCKRCDWKNVCYDKNDNSAKL